MRDALDLIKVLLFGPPHFFFDHRLYSQLVREVKNGQNIKAPVQDPEVRFTMGPLDGVLGSEDPRTGRITIDVLENFLYAMKTNRCRSTEELKQKFDERLTRTLAHEGGHWHLQKRHGWLPTIEKFAMHTVFMTICYLVIYLNTRLVTRLLFPVVHKIFGLGEILGPILGLMTLVALAWVLIKLSMVFFSFWRAMATAATYRFCWEERHARAWEKKPDEDSRWDPVVEVNQ